MKNKTPKVEKINKSNFFKENWTIFYNNIKENHVVLILSLVTFLICSFISFVKISITPTVSSKVITEYEVGQIADETIIAPKALKADANYPFAIEKDEKIIRKGFVITLEQYNKLRKMAASPAYIDIRSFFNSLLYLFFLELLFYFLLAKNCPRERIYIKRPSAKIGVKEKEKLWENMEFKELATESFFLVIIYAITSIASKTEYFSLPLSMGLVMPVSLCSLIVAILFGQLNAIFFSIIAAFAVLNAAENSVELFFYVSVTSLISSRIVKNADKRTDLVSVSLWLAVINMLILFASKIIFKTSFNHSLHIFAGFAFNGFISGILCIGLLTPIELLLNTTSVFRLDDLRSDSQKTQILQRMQDEASGTFTHSQNVASMAERACREIGANGALAYVAALYHDIGKVDKPLLFTENHREQDRNVHNELDPNFSRTIIQGHVKRGMDIAENELKLPKRIVQMISEHHGNSVLSFFYNKAKEQDASVSPEDYRYPHNPPTTKESAVLMLADTVEAACSSKQEASRAELESFIKKLINAKIDDNQLKNCNLTYRDIAKITQVFLDIEDAKFHTNKRIKYQGQKEEEQRIHAQEALNNSANPSNDTDKVLKNEVETPPQNTIKGKKI